MNKLSVWSTAVVLSIGAVVAWVIFADMRRHATVPTANPDSQAIVIGRDHAAASQTASPVAKAAGVDRSPGPVGGRSSDGSRQPMQAVVVSPQARKLLSSVSNLGSLYKDLKSRESTLNGDELLALRELLESCNVIAFIVQDMRATSGAVARVSANPARASAAEKLSRACADVPDSELSVQRRLALSSELNRREHAIVGAETLKAMTDIGFGTQSHDRAEALLANADPAVMRGIADYLAHEIRFTGMSADFRARGLDVEQLTSGWQLAACDLAGACGPESLNLLEACVILARCDVDSLADYMRKYEPEKFASADQFRQLVVASYRSGDWSWLNLPTLRAKLPA